MDDKEKQGKQHVRITVTLSASTLHAIDESITDIITSPGGAVDSMIAVFCPTNIPDALEGILNECLSITKGMTAEVTADAVGLTGEALGKMFEHDQPFLDAYDSALSVISESYREAKGKEFVLDTMVMIPENSELLTVDMEITQKSLDTLFVIQNRLGFSLSDTINFLFTRLHAKSAWLASSLLVWAAIVVTGRLEEKEAQNAITVLAAYFKTLADGRKNGFSDLHKFVLSTVTRYIAQRETPDSLKLIQFPETEE